MRARTVLVVEDELSTRMLYLSILSAVPNLTVLSASSAAEATMLASLCPFDLAILDLVLPDGSGFDVLEALRDHKAPDQVVLVSAHIDEFRQSVRIGPNLILMEKPVATDRLLSVVNAAPDGDEDEFAFTIVEYLQIACIGLHSVDLEVTRGGAEVGRVAIRDGQLWDAAYQQHAGERAFRHIVALERVAVVCHAPVVRDAPRFIRPEWQPLLTDAARPLAAQPREAGPALEELIARAAAAVRGARFHDAYQAYLRVLERDATNELARRNADRLTALGFDSPRDEPTPT